MKLHYAGASPFVRKVMVCAIIRGLDGRIEKVSTNPHLSPAELLADNPLSRVPAMVTESGDTLYDSPVICEYLDTLGDAAPLVPPAGAARIASLKWQALGDGIMDAAVARRMQAALPQDEPRVAFGTRQAAVVGRALDVLEHTDLSGPLEIGRITIGCALGYLDFRFAHEDWKTARPKLAAWWADISTRPGFAETTPVG